jgi:hypothetical protein
LPAVPDHPNSKKPRFYWLFRHGTGFADPSGWKVEPRDAALVGVLLMFFALGAASTAIDAIKSLTSSSSSSPASTGFGQNSNDPFGLSGDTSASGSSAPATGFSGGGSQISPATMSALLAAQGETGSTASATTSPSSALQDLFSQIDANGDGEISKSEFENALGAGGTNLAQADDVFNKLDSNGDGSVNLGELSSALKGAEGKGGHDHHAHVGGSNGSSDSNGADSTNNSSATSAAGAAPLLQALLGASSTSATNSNGSTTTSLTYADGSSVSMTSPPATTSSSTATSSYNLIEQMVQRQAQAISFSPTAFALNA